VSENVPPDLEAVDNEIQRLRTLGNEIGRLRDLRGLSQVRLEEESGISRSVIKELEGAIKRKRRARGTLEKVSVALGMPHEYLDDILNGRRTPEVPTPGVPENPVMRMLGDMREEFGEKFSALEEHLGKIGADLVREHRDLAQRFDALYQRINSPEVTIDLGEHRHDQDAPD
jgi:transcriptional regulator with XRE-family HTH domain